MSRSKKQFPKNWILSTVGASCSIRNDLREPISVTERGKIQGIFPYYGPTGILDYIDDYKLNGKFALIGEDGDHFLKYKDKPQTLLVEGQFNVNNHAHVIEPTELCSAEWFFYYFQHRNIKEFLTRQGAGRYKLNKDSLERLAIVLPPLPEQERIAAILSTWDEAIAKTQALIDRKTQFRKNISESLIEHTDASQQELLKFVALRKDRINPVNLKSETPCVELEHIDQGTGRILGTIDARGQASIKAVFEPGDVLFGKLRPYLRKFALPDFSGTCSTEIWVLSQNQDLCTPAYLFQLVQTERFITAACKTSGSKMPRADWELMAESLFPLPSIDEQIKIANVLMACSEEIDLLAKQVNILKQQKQGLMQKLLTGDWPVLPAAPQLQEVAG